MAVNQKAVSIQDLAPVMVRALQAGQSVELTVPGRSMHPTLLDRVSTVRLAPLDRPKKNDMVFYRRSNGGYVLHRVIAVEQDGTCTLCGDAQWEPERGLRRDQLLAVVTEFRRRDRWTSCTNPVYRLWVACLPLLRLAKHVKASLRYRLGRLRKPKL